MEESKSARPVNENELDDTQMKAVTDLLNITVVYYLDLSKYGIPNKTAPYISVAGQSDRDSMIEGIVEYIKQTYPEQLEQFREKKLRQFLRSRHYQLLKKAKPIYAR